MTLRDFILEHADDDVAGLLLSRGKWPGIDIDKAATIIECRRKIRTKLPEWYAEPEIIYPDRICAEQSSSSATAEYKALVAKDICSGKPSFRMADLTGGLGADSLTFSRVASAVMYNEMNPDRAEAAVHNFGALGSHNIEVSCFCVEPESVRSALFWDRLRAFRPDLIYMDPARRSSTGSKVFLLEDCSPDILTLTKELFAVAPSLLVKLSPMADISMLVRRLLSAGAATRAVHVVSAAGECKELLLHLVPAGPSEDVAYTLIVNENGHVKEFDSASEENSVPDFFNDEEGLRSMSMLFEPGKSLAKAGLFNAVCSSLGAGLVKAARSTHLYFSPDAPKGDSDMQFFGKVFDIVDIVPLNKQSIKAFGAKYPKAEVSARNISMTSDGLRKKLKVQSGGNVHIFGIGIDFGGRKSSNWLVAAVRRQTV